jgi:hypothetical protein
MREKLPFGKALIFIFSTMVGVLVLGAFALVYIDTIRSKRTHDPAFKIVALAQSTPDPQALKTAYLAELLGLAVDRPMNLYRYDAQEAKSKLLASALIKEAEIIKIKPGTLLVDYVLRQPVAFLADYSNTAIDSEGVLIPFKPFFTPKKLPEIHMGLSAFGEGVKEGDEEGGKWGKPLQGARARLALELFKIITERCCKDALHVLRIDVSKAFALSYGQRQIVVVFEERVPVEGALVVFPVILRLTSSRYPQELANYLELRKHLEPQLPESQPLVGIVKGKTQIVDLRVPQLAFLSR